MKRILIIIILISLIYSVSAIDVNIVKKDANDMIYELQNSVNFELKVTSNDGSDISFYNLLGFQMSPSEEILFSKGETKNINLSIIPIGNFEHKGAYTFSYYITDASGEDVKKTLTFRAVELKNAFEIGAEEINLDKEKVDIYIKNNANYNFENINTKFDSAFFEFERKFSLKPYEKKTFSINVNKEDIKELIAGFYTLEAEVEVEDNIVKFESPIEFSEIENLKINKENYGFLIQTEIIKKENKGNVVNQVTTVIKKNIFSRLFTRFNPEPDVVDRRGSEIYYTWNKELKPNEKLEVIAKTNWLYPLLIIIFIILIIVFSKRYAQKDVFIKKKVSFVKAKGGEFALKVSIFVSAKSRVESVNLVDKLPPLVKIYERFGGEEPSKVDSKRKKIEWYFGNLESGEKRVINYVLYSKVGVLGRFALPSATAIYEKEGKIKESNSNRAFFISEQKSDFNH